MKLEDLDYDLPESAIAQRPLEDRASSRLLWLHRESGRIEDRSFRDVLQILQPGDLLVLNDTRVTALRLMGQKPTGGQVELLLLKHVGERRYEALARPGRRLQPGATVEFDQGLTARIEDNLPEGRKLVSLDSPSDTDALLKEVGRVPLPPYIHEELHNAERYQTVYAQTGGSAAAPTAGLHFTPELLDRLHEKGIRTAWVTLDVGLDTFRPISSEDPLDHVIHGETCHLPEATKLAIKAAEGRIIAVGTTSVRTLESFATGPRKVESGSKPTRLYITPGYRFKIVDGMFTNFHMPRTTMLMMIAAMAGREAVMSAYEHAVESGYRFLSFGDSMLIL